LGYGRPGSDVLDVALNIKGKVVEGVVMGDKMQREADRLLAQIVRTDSMITAVKAGARAEVSCLGWKPPAHCAPAMLKGSTSFSKLLWWST
jgi:hypothetical protein